MSVRATTLFLPQRLGVAGLAALSLVAALLWPTTNASGLPETSMVELGPTASAMGPVEIVDVDTAVVWADSEPAEVVVSVRNRGSRSVTAEVWWLASATGDPEPWVDPVGRGRPRRVTLAPGETRAVTVKTLDMPGAGTWNLSLWAHVLNGERREHSHGASTTPWLRVLSTDAELVRFSAPRDRATISEIRPSGRLVGDPATGEPDALVTVAATTQQPTVVQVRCYLTPRAEAEPWTRGSAVASRTETVILDGVAAGVAPCVFDELPGSSRWSLSAFLWRQGGVLPEPPVDGVRARTQLTLDTAQPPSPETALPPETGQQMQARRAPDSAPE